MVESTVCWDRTEGKSPFLHLCDHINPDVCYYGNRGKTTLLKYLAARKIPLPVGMEVLLVEQEVPGLDTPVIEQVRNSCPLPYVGTEQNATSFFYY